MLYKIVQNFNSKLRRNFTKLIRFAAVGFMGALINLLIYFSMTEVASLGLNISAMAAFGSAAINNYILNHLWTFNFENQGRPLNVKQFFYYLLGNLIGLSVNLFALNLLSMTAGIEYHLIWQMAGIILGAVFNFVFAKKLVFQISKTKSK